MRICLINPAYSATFWDLRGIPGQTSARALAPSPALPRLAALVPFDARIHLCEENIEDVPVDEPWDLVGITGYSNQARRMIQLADQFRERGVFVVMGGVQVSQAPQLFRDHADTLVIGEAEDTWPRFLADHRQGRAAPEYTAATGEVDLGEDVTSPRLDLLDSASFATATVQSARGCPHDCEFCSVVALQGHRLRCRPTDTVVRELDALARAGFGSVFLADDNLGASRRHALELLGAIGDWAQQRGASLPLFAQGTVALNRDNEVLAAARRAGLESLFVGVETPNTASLSAAGKGHNVLADLAGRVEHFNDHGVMVQAGMVLGFDQDGPPIFDQHFEFLQAASVPVPMVSLLVALPGTRLERRLADEGRLLPEHAFGTAYELTTNFTPAQMTSDDLTRGYIWLLNRLFAPDAFSSRLARAAARWPATDDMPAPAAASGFGITETSRLMASLAELGSAFDEAMELGFRLLMERPPHARKVIFALLFWRHILSLLQGWGVWDPAPSERYLPR